MPAPACQASYRRAPTRHGVPLQGRRYCAGSCAPPRGCRRRISGLGWYACNETMQAMTPADMHCRPPEMARRFSSPAAPVAMPCLPVVGALLVKAEAPPAAAAPTAPLNRVKMAAVGPPDWPPLLPFLLIKKVVPRGLCGASMPEASVSRVSTLSEPPSPPGTAWDLGRINAVALPPPCRPFSSFFCLPLHSYSYL